MRGVAIVVMALCLASAAEARDGIGERIASSAAAAESLQGPLDGTWTLKDARGRTLAVFQIGDPAAGGPLQCAWRGPNGALGPANCRRERGRLSLRFQADGAPARARLRRVRSGDWRGLAWGAGRARAVTLRKG
ncbi:MAG: hypothetical protein ACREEB_11835 [Caulobacteraceae bacterium]